MKKSSGMCSFYRSTNDKLYFFRKSDVCEIFTDLETCEYRRTIVLTIIGILKSLIVDCPAAFVWNLADSKSGLEQLCGSPFDKFSDVEELLCSSSSGKSSDIIRLRIQEIRMRSENVEKKWDLGISNEAGFGRVFKKYI